MLPRLEEQAEQEVAEKPVSCRPDVAFRNVLPDENRDSRA